MQSEVPHACDGAVERFRITWTLFVHGEPRDCFIGKHTAAADTRDVIVNKASTKTQRNKKTVSKANADKQPCLMVTDDDLHLFAQGTWQRSWEKMGAHAETLDGVAGWRFCVWAPDVTSVHVVGDFNDWDVHANPLEPIASSGIWQAFVPGLIEGDLYKYAIETETGEILYKADPYAFEAECPPGTASKLYDINGYTWKDARWMTQRASGNHMKKPLNIYEVHLGSWKRHGDEPQGEPREDGTWPGPMDEFPAQRGTYYSYADLSKKLVSYVKDMGYTHIEILPVMEHPFDGSWGYQTTGYYAATSRFGNPKELMGFVDACHKAGIGVIMDWVPGGFCADAHGLAKFNGNMLYEHEIHPNWGTHKFDFARGEVRSFLVSNVMFWLGMFHADGIRMDGVSSMLYLNFGIDDPGQKKFNKYGTEEDLDASAFIRQVNSAVEAAHPDVMMMAEESTAWPLVTYPPEEGGLGFHYKWDMGWMNDTLHYMQTDFPWRPGNHSLLTFSIMYAFSENFICPLSHDEVVHGKCSLIGRMPGDWWRQFAGLRTLAFYQMMHPGAKLNFMGNEIAQFIEWRYYESIQWFLTEEYETHAHHQAFIRALNHLYTQEPALWENAYTDDGFTWIDADNSQQSLVTFVRSGEKEKNDLVVLINFDPASYPEYKIGVPREGDWKVIFDSDKSEFGGSDYALGQEIVSSKPEPWNDCENSIDIKVPGLCGLVLKRVRKSSYKKTGTKSKTGTVAKPSTKTPGKANAEAKAKISSKPSVASKTKTKRGSTSTKASKK